MIVDTEDRKIIRVGPKDDESSFGVANDADLAHLFRVLRSQMYSDKIKAVIREYSTNAMDAHIDVGKDNVPFDVTLPTEMNPYFTIRDYGPGLSEDGIRKVYTQYGASLKRGTNAMNGMFGLGSKSAFAYGDSFTINSYHNGVLSVYEAYLDETDLGKVRKLMSVDTDAISGIEIKIPVRKHDINAFANKAASVYKHFSVQPNVKNMSSHDMSPIKFRYKGDGWGIVDAASWNGNAFYAVMGNVCYPISMSTIYSSAPKEVWQGLDSLNRLTLYLNFKIGSLSISSSRESLDYNRKTMENICKRIREMMHDMLKETRKEVEGCSDIVEAKRVFSKVKKDRSIRSVFIDANDGLVWNGVKITSPFFTIPRDGQAPDVAGIKLFSIEKSITNESGISRKTLLGPSVNSLNSARNFIFDEQTIIALNDSSSRWVSRVKTLLAQDGVKKVLVFSAEKGADALFDKIGIPSSYIVRLSNIALQKVKRTSSSGTKNSAKVFRLSGVICYGGSSKSRNWTPQAVDLEKDSGVYVMIDRYTPFLRGQEITALKLKRFAELWDKAFKDNLLSKLYGVKRKTVYDKFRCSAKGSKYKQWVALDEYVDQKVSEVIKDDKIVSACFANYMSFSGGNSRLRKHILPENYTGFGKDDLGVLGQYHEFLMKAKEVGNEREQEVKTIYYVLVELNLLGKLQSAAMPLEQKRNQFEKDILKTYPLLAHLEQYNRPETKFIVDYIRGINCLRKRSTKNEK